MLDQLDMFADIGPADYRDTLTQAERDTLQAARTILAKHIAGREVISSWTALQDYLAVTMGALRAESFRVLYLDRRNVLIADEEAGRGTVDHVPAYPREIARRALALDASAIILAHNHPSGQTTPSDGDIKMTKAIKAALQAVGITLHDHVIAGADTTHSMAACGEL